ncbi:hypothetical protein K488DRAFT_90560 [Vararia minispora EC-137]|uniref:Uncharacterized protein n=1 Tax=Vararia minispora EC-137 TaxID=1314806 RepID=A0ACB8Q7M4_9AGAM|nr:hypothetical protein K488DRAFT_90560 [Vararia minispora EC-137]
MSSLNDPSPASLHPSTPAARARRADRPPSTHTDDTEDRASIRDDISIISAIRPVPPLAELPEIPATDLDLALSLDSILGATDSTSDAKVQKRASNVLKLSEENEKLKAELKAMSDRLEAAERRRIELENQWRARGSGHGDAPAGHPSQPTAHAAGTS